MIAEPLIVGVATVCAFIILCGIAWGLLCVGCAGLAAWDAWRSKSNGRAM